MSAFVVSDNHISVLARYAVKHGLTSLNVDKVGAMLHEENVRSVNHRYSEATQPEFTYNPSVANVTEIELIKLAHCLDYQSCEHDGWTTSGACELLRNIAEHASRRIPGYAEARWSLD